MKKGLIISLLTILIVTQSKAFTTILTSSIYADPYDTVYVDMPCSNIPSNAPRIHFVNNASSTLPELSRALTAASKIFTKALNEELIDLVPIEAEISIGEASDFVNSTEVCKVNVVYTDTIEGGVYYNLINQYNNYPYPVLIPKALSNQGRGYSNGVSMYIVMRPNIAFHCDTTAPPANKYDAITILLRALAIGCGIQSSFNASTFQIGIPNGSTTYINAFDAQIYNEDNVTLFDVFDGALSLSTFLNGKAVYVSGMRSHITWTEGATYKLYNGWETGLGGSLNHLTLNTLSHQSYTASEISSGFMDLMDFRLGKGVAIRDVTPYTMGMLTQLGWMFTLPVGDPLPEIYSSYLLCDTILSPNTEYQISTSSLDVEIDDAVCELNSHTGTYSIGTIDNNNVFSYSSISNNIQWERNPITKNIIGQIKANVWQFYDWRLEQIKIHDIEIPYRPNKPIINRTETASLGKIHLSLNAFADGSDTYTVTYTGLTDGLSHTFNVSAYAIDTILHLPPTQYYDVAVYGTNSQGNSDTFYFTIGSSVPHSLTLTVSVSSNTLTYDLSNHGQIDPNLIFVSAAGIFDLNGNLEKLAHYKDWTQPINISSLSSGYHVLVVVANGQTYSKLFRKL